MCAEQKKKNAYDRETVEVGSGQSNRDNRKLKRIFGVWRSRRMYSNILEIAVKLEGY